MTSRNCLFAALFVLATGCVSAQPHEDLTSSPTMLLKKSRNLDDVALSALTKLAQRSPTFRATVASTAVVGDAVYISGSGAATLSRANAAGTAIVHGFVVEKITDTDAEIQTEGLVTLSGLTAGADYYLSAASAGDITATAPTAPNYVVRVGQALSTTQLRIGPSDLLNFGSVVPSMVTSKTIFIPASQLVCADSNGCSAGEQGGKETVVFADASADDHANVTVMLPDDFAKGTSGLHVRVWYNMPSGTPGAGEWDIKYLAVADDDADAALGNELTIVDTPAAADDWNRTAAAVIPFAAITANDYWVTLDLYHDVAVPFGGAVEVLGLEIGYTTSKNY